MELEEDKNAAEEEALRGAEEALREAEDALRPQRPAPVVKTAGPVLRSPERRVLSASLAHSSSLGRLPLIRMASLAELKRTDQDA